MGKDTILVKSKKIINDIFEIKKDVSDQYKKSWQKRIGASYYKVLKKNLPIKENTILYECNWGRGVIDNPYAIFKHLIENDEYKNYTHIWALNEKTFETQKLYSEYKNRANVLFVKTHSQEYLKALVTSKYLINNATFPYYFVKRDGQIYINTWHGTPLKQMGYDLPDGNIVSSNVTRNFLFSDYLISANSIMTNMYLDSYKLQGIMPGKIIEEGYPRNDLLVKTPREDIINKLSLNDVYIDSNKITIVYAPTWRQSAKGGAVVNPDELLTIKAAIEEKLTPGKYQLLLKPHQFVYEELKGKSEYKGMLIPSYLDANEILSVTDILISDFSSIFLDYLCLNRPVIFYVPDLEIYSNSRGLNFDIKDLPGPVCSTLDDVATAILNENEDNTYADNIIRDIINEHEDGNVTERICNVIFSGETEGYNIIESTQKKQKLLIFGGTVYINGIFNALLSLLNNIDYEVWDVTLLLLMVSKEPLIVKAVKEDINKNVRVIVRQGTLLNTQFGEIKREFINRRGVFREIWDKLYPYDATNTEYKRLFGNAEFDYIINYEGYNRTFAPVMLAGNAKKKSIWLHSDMKADMHRTVNGEKKNYISLHYIISLYSKYDNIISCARSVMEVNREKLSTPETYSKYKYARNSFNKVRFEDRIAANDVFTSEEEEWLCLNSKETLEKPLFNMSAVRLPDKSKTNFIAVGRLSTEKNYIALISAFARYLKKYPDSCLYILGQGPLRDELEEHIKYLKVQDAVFLPGNVTNPFAFLKRCDCFVLPSLHEGLPLVLLEARACDLPILVSNFSTVKDSLVSEGQLVIDKDETGIYKGLCAFKDGKVPTRYFDIDEYNRVAYEEFVNAIQ